MKKLSFCILLGFSVLLCNTVFFSCSDDKRNKSHALVPLENIERGRVLATKYCQSCHLLPDPSLLNSKSWEDGVLPNMGPYLGIFHYDFKLYPSGRRDPNLPANFYPSEPVISYVDWQYIIDYYTSLSPDSLLPQAKKNIRESFLQFQVDTPKIKLVDPALSLVKIEKNQLVVGDMQSQTLYRFDKKLQLIDSTSFQGTPVEMIPAGDKYLICNVEYINPNNASLGKLQYVSLSNGKLQTGPSIIDSLQRPVQFVEADLNNDKRMDYVVCEFGFNTGNLSWIENLGSNKFQRHLIKPIAGATKAIVEDYNKNGLPDLWVLFAQGNEGVFLFTNKGSGKFSEQQVLKFPPAYGSTYFEMTDFNGDGWKDIIYTCGDNADYSPVLKPYHGVYIFLNDGNNHFRQEFFYPINGCYKAMPRDFDKDGDLDIAAISFFADYVHQPEEGFIYLENKGDFKFDAFSSKETQRGRWLTMDAGDIDGDGNLDIVLGNFTYSLALLHSTYDWKKGPPFLVLRNIGKKDMLTK